MTSLIGWLWRGGLSLLLVLVGVLFARGWQRQQSNDDVPPRWQLATFIGGLVLAGLALVSSLEAYAGEFFWVRVVQLILLSGWIPLLLLVSNPYPFVKGGLSAETRHHLRTLDHNYPTIRKAIYHATAPGFVWGLFVANFWLWHDDAMIELSRMYGWVHVIEVTSVLGTACLYWWHISAAEPRLYSPMPTFVRMLYAFAGVLPIKFMGLVLLFGSETVVGGYRVHDAATLMVQVGNLTFADKSLGAMLIWIVGGVTYTYAATFLAGRFVGVEEDKPPLPVNPLEQDDLWTLPGLGD